MFEGQLFILDCVPVAMKIGLDQAKWFKSVNIYSQCFMAERLKSCGCFVDILNDSTILQLVGFQMGGS